ncbi:hypothetical protein J5N97_021127 [Dioscorea zingiberensis]|uniref:Protein disulfide-isomerase n=1 Tax=Dioscorea zingiberensis TaxID=325984 RepID=A0A9D5CH33_9LILI|nr:hypothetical protein J5N97_021127 [Dioscorea zingiberensis]
MAVSRVWIHFAVVVLLVSSCFSPAVAEESVSEEPSSVLTLDAANFSETIAKHPFIVVEFYAPWCGHCKRLAPEELASKYEVKGFPTLKILRNEGKNIQDYKGPRDADGIVEHLKKQVGPASAEIKSSEDASNLISEKKVFIVGVFPEYSGEQFKNFITVAEKLRSDYDFGHTSDAKFLPHGDLTINQPTVRLFKPFDELLVDTQDFNVDALENFIEASSVPSVTIFNKDPSNHLYVTKFFNSPHAKAMLFLNFSNGNFDSFKSKFQDVAEHYKGKGIIFLVGDLDASQGAFQYFGLKGGAGTAIIIQNNDGVKYLKVNLEPDHIATWLKEYKDGSLTPFTKSEPIPEVNDEPVKIVVANSLKDVVFNSGKNVLLEFYAPWCGHCKKLAPILDEVAVSFENDANVIIAKMDGTTNDIPSEFEVRGYPTVYFSSATNKIMQYDGDRTAEAIINFIQKNRDTDKETLDKEIPVQSDSGKDEL